MASTADRSTEELTLPSGLKTGDTLACFGEGCTSGIISRLTQPYFWKRAAPSHIAGIVVYPDGSIYVFESTTQTTLPDHFTGRVHRGIQAHRLEDWLAHYTGRVELLRLKVELRPTSAQRAVAYAMDCHQTQVEYDLSGAIHSGSPIRNVEDGSKLFCSEFWAFFLRYAGALSAAANPSEFTPHNVYRLPCFSTPEVLKPALVLSRKEAA